MNATPNTADFPYRGGHDNPCAYAAGMSDRCTCAPTSAINLPEACVQATRYEVSIFPEGAEPRRHFTITVEWRGEGRWAVLDGPYCLGTDGEWEYEPQPSNRDDTWLDAHRFDLDTARELAKKAAPYLVVNGRSALEIYRRIQTEESR